MIRPSRLGLALALAMVTVVAGAGAAVAVAAPAGPSFLRLAHLSPDTPTVDVYLASVGDASRRFTVPGVDYGAVSDYRALPADTYTVSMRAAGAPAESPPVISTTLTTDSGAAYTVAGTGLYAQLGLAVLSDELSMPAAGEARIRVVNAAATAPQVDLAITGGPAIASGVGFAETTGYRSVPTGVWTVEVRTPGAQDPTRLPVQITSNAVYTVLLLDEGDTFAAELIVDSAGSATVPLGGIDTGQGGTAGSWGAVELAMLAAAGGMAAVLVRRVRRTGSAGS